MEITYTLHTNLDHCSINYKGQNYSYKELKKNLKKRGRLYVKKSKIKNKEITIEILNQEFDKTEMSKKEVTEFFTTLRQTKANIWKSKLRNLRRKGKLEQHKIDIMNQYGMSWNPKEDLWEVMFELYKKNILSDILERLIKDYGISTEKIKDLFYLEEWKKKQVELYKSNKLSKENLTRLEFVNFPFKSDNDTNEMSLFQLVMCVYNINELKYEIGRGGDVERNVFIIEYQLSNAKNHKGATINITESAINSKRSWEKVKPIKIINKAKKSAISKIGKEESEAIQKLGQKPIEFFIKEIDNICLRRGSKYWTLYDRKINICNTLENYLSNNYYDKTSKLWVKFKFDDEVKRYASEKIISILDKKLIKTGRLNHKKSFKAISFLIKHYDKKQNFIELNRISEIINNHQILSLIYLKKLEKVLSQY